MGTDRIPTKKNNNGKGGDFATRPNPFGKVIRIHGAPELAGADMVAKALDRVVRAGCAVMLGLTRDEGALCITILDGADRHRTYCSNEQELDDAVAAMYEMYSPD